MPKTVATPCNERFTAWLSARERQALRDTAHRLRTSENYVVRVALRQALQLDRKIPTQTTDNTERP